MNRAYISCELTGMNAWHISDPTIPKIRMAVQSLAGRNHRPFPGGATFTEKPRRDHMFRGYIDPESVQQLVDAGAAMFEVDEDVFEIGSTGVIFRVTKFVKGAFIFTERDPTVLKDLQQ